MFKKFSVEDVLTQNQVKASVQREIRQSIADEYLGLELVLDDLLPKKSPLIVAKLAITAEGKQHALAIGLTKMSAKDIRAINKGISVDNMHYLNDGLWKMEKLE
ncbi:hypothetical protein ACLOJK_010813 [Asimina triloba]